MLPIHICYITQSYAPKVVLLPMRFHYASKSVKPKKRWSHTSARRVLMLPFILATSRSSLASSFASTVSIHSVKYVLETLKVSNNPNKFDYRILLGAYSSRE
jgi:hypothetical protein